MNFSEILKDYRKKKQLTQSELALLLNVSSKTVSSWENGRSYPDITMLRSLSIVLEISPNLILGVDDSHINDYDMSKEELKVINENINCFKRNIIIASCIPFLSWILTITLSIFSNSSLNDPFLYQDYIKTFTILYIIFTIISFLSIIISIIISLISYQTVNNNIDLSRLSYNKIKIYKFLILYFFSLIINIIPIVISFIPSMLNIILIMIVSYVSCLLFSVYQLYKFDLKVKFNVFFIMLPVLIILLIISIITYMIYNMQWFLFVMLIIVYFLILIMFLKVEKRKQ